MRGTLLPAAPSRVRGRKALERRLAGLLRAVVRFSLHRASTDADKAWAAQAVDLMTEAHRRLTGAGTVTQPRPLGRRRLGSSAGSSARSVERYRA